MQQIERIIKGAIEKRSEVVQSWEVRWYMHEGLAYIDGSWAFSV